MCGGRRVAAYQAKSVVLGVNGEIYNHEELKARFFKDYPFYTKSDCEVSTVRTIGPGGAPRLALHAIEAST